MQVRTPSAVAPATTRTRPLTWRTTVSSTRTRSVSFMRATSLVTPSAVRPLTPAPMKRSTTRLRLSRSRSPAAVKGVGRTEYTPSSFKQIPPRTILRVTLILYPGDKHEVHSPAVDGRIRCVRSARRNPRGRRIHAGAVQIDLRVLRLRRAELHVHEGRQETDWRTTGSQSRAGGDSSASPAGDGRRNAGDQVGIDQRVYRGCQRETGVRLDHCGPHLRYVYPGEGAALRRDRLHARSALHQSATLGVHLPGPRRRHGSALPPAQLEQQAGPGRHT